MNTLRLHHNSIECPNSTKKIISRRDCKLISARRALARAPRKAKGIPHSLALSPGVWNWDWIKPENIPLCGARDLRQNCGYSAKTSRVFASAPVLAFNRTHPTGGSGEGRGGVGRFYGYISWNTKTDGWRHLLWLKSLPPPLVVSPRTIPGDRNG